jgi:hypothetical protein
MLPSQTDCSFIVVPVYQNQYDENSKPHTTTDATERIPAMEIAIGGCDWSVHRMEPR